MGIFWAFCPINAWCPVGFQFRSVRFWRLGTFSILFLDLASAAETSLGGSSLAAKSVLSWSEIGLRWVSLEAGRKYWTGWMHFPFMIETWRKEIGKSGVAIKACRRNSGVKPRTEHLIGQLLFALNSARWSHQQQLWFWLWKYADGNHFNLDVFRFQVPWNN